MYYIKKVALFTQKRVTFFAYPRCYIEAGENFPEMADGQFSLISGRERKSDIMQFSSVSLATCHPSHAPNGNPPRGKALRVFASDRLMKRLGKYMKELSRDLIWGSLSFPLAVSYNYSIRNRFETCISRRHIWQQRKR